MIGCLRNAGFSTELVGHTVALLDAFVYGFAIQEAALPTTGGDELAELAGEILASLDPDAYPHFVDYARERVLGGDYEFGDEFDFGLEVVLDGIEHRLATRL